MVEHKPVRVPHVAAVAELADVFPKVLGRYVRVGASDRALDEAPMPFNRIGVVDAPHPFLGFVVDLSLIHI